MTSSPQRCPQQPSIRQLSLPLESTIDSSPSTRYGPETATAPNVCPAAVWPTLSAAQQAQAHRLILEVVAEVLREVRSNG